MKNSKGFTLIELLAVLILISIVAVISTPKILNVIEQSKVKAYEQSSNSISDAAKFKQNSEIYKNGEFTSDYSFAGGNYADKSEKLPFKGDTPYSGMLHLNKSGETALAFLFKDNKNYYCVTKNYNDKKSSGTKIKTGNDCSITLPEGLVLSAEMDEIEEFVQVDDSNPGVICGDEKEENYSGVNECHIKSVEDFVELSVLVNSGKDFNGKNVVLDNDIDFNNDLSYINSNNTNFGDFNEDGVTESIKKEVSESYGFQPIGNNTKNFKGVFLGNNNKIKGIYINRTEQDYVGLFGFVSGNIKNVSIESANVKGKNYVGTLAGKLSGINSNGFTVNNLNVSGSGSIGSIFGDAPKVLSIYAENVNVKGDTSVGGIIGNGGYSKYSDSVIIKNSTVTGTTNTKMISGGQYGSVKNYLAVNVKLNDEDVSNSTLEMIEDINGLEAAGIDTYVGGDNDSDGFYFDYNKKNKIIITNTEDNPIIGLTIGTGTKIDPYIISSEEDWKKATAMINNTTYYFKLTKDLDFSNKKFYMLGSKTIQFKGILDGNNKKISSVILDLEKSSYIGLSGSINGGIIKNINIDKFNIKADTYVGALAGEQRTDANAPVNVTNSNVSGNSHVGGVYGAARLVSYVVTDNINVEGTTSVGGIVGEGGYSKYTSNTIMKNSKVTGTSAAKAISGGQYGSSKNYLLLNVKLNDEDASNSTLEMLEDINGLEAAGIDTYIGGDNDNSGYYFDYNDQNKIVIKNTEDNPIIGLTNGIGTKDDPYLISNEEDWKEATSMINNTTYYFKLTKNLDFSNKKFYMFGSKTTPFNGILDGNNKKISSVTLNLEKSSYIGLSGYASNGVIKNINIDKFIVKGDSYVGTLTGEQRVDINASVNVTNSNVSGNSYVGGVYGAARTVSYVVTDNVNVKGNTSVGGIVGNVGSSKYTSNTIIKNSKVTGTSAAKAISGGQYGSSKNYLLLNVKLNDEDASNSTLEMLEDINGLEAAGIDTYIGGDNDNSGYYFDYNDQNKIVIKNTEDNPIIGLTNGIGTKDDPYLISNEEDWKEATSMINNTTYYFKLTKNLDFSNKKFYMFGSKTTPFNGILDGNNKKISSVTLNLEKSSYIGLSGYASNGVIKNINIDKFIVKGDSYVGTLTGEQRVDINASVNVTNSNVSGNSYVGGVYGAARTLSYVTIDNVNVKGDTSVGGIVGNVGSSKYTSNTVMKNSMVTGTTYTKAINGGQYGSSRNYLLLNIKLNNEDVSNSTTDTINDINTYEVAGIDTYIGGDNDNTGYYFDYNDQNKIVIKNTEDNPIVQLENGTGTKENPYLISNEEDWKKASATSTTSDTYFKLTKDLDFSNKKFYMLGSKNNEFKGTLDGNGKKISNLSINVPKVAGFDYVGIIGKGGSAYGINLDNIKVTGYNYVGALFGSTRGTVRDIYASNLNISGNNYIGGIGGDINTNSPRPTSMIISANVEGNSYVGITTGSSYLGIEQIAIIGGSVKGSSYVGRLSGNTVSWNDTYALETIPNGNGGKDCWKTIPSDANLSDLSIYKNMNIDTSLTGDTDGVGYYFDVDKNGNIFVTK